MQATDPLELLWVLPPKKVAPHMTQFGCELQVLLLVPGLKSCINQCTAAGTAAIDLTVMLIAAGDIAVMLMLLNPSQIASNLFNMPLMG